MRVVHESGRVLATNVDTADSLLSQGLGLMFRRSIPDDYALVFRFGSQKRRSLHMLCVPFDIDAVWLCDGVVQRVTTMRAWTGHGAGVGDTVVELPAGALDGVEAGDRVTVEG
ncbi:DUF192 domain-containing protein [Halomarina litorea]|uniref:DUF192 domain-containing protein n=1 Tax=Halomarina litorea TaxID=2961595 RepID=UPI0020C49513|nr:DUF192 domain-containing protein [Halomarina sp. BCD28]